MALACRLSADLHCMEVLVEREMAPWARVTSPNPILTRTLKIVVHARAHLNARCRKLRWKDERVNLVTFSVWISLSACDEWECLLQRFEIHGDLEKAHPPQIHQLPAKYSLLGEECCLDFGTRSLIPFRTIPMHRCIASVQDKDRFSQSAAGGE